MAKRPAPSLRQLGLAVGLTAALTLLEVGGALQSRSMALWGEAAHFLADLWAFAVAAYALRPVPPDSRLSYGRGQTVALGGLVNGLLQGTLAVAIAVEAYQRWGHPEPIESGVMLAIAVLGLGVNLGLLRTFGGMHVHEDDAVEGTRIHFLADAGLCAATVLTALGVTAGAPVQLDAALALLAAGLMGWTAVRLVGRVGHTLLAGLPAEVDTTGLLAELDALPGVARAHHLHLWKVGAHIAGSVHLELPTPVPGVLAHAQAILARRGVTHATIQVETTCPDGPCD